MTSKVFVYGTLKQGNRVRGMHMFGNAEFVGDAETTHSNYHMYSLGAFPAVVLGGKSKISGEVFDVDSETMKYLDQIEGYPDFYTRDIVDTSLGKAWMYHITDIENYNAKPLTPQGDTITWSR